MKQKRYWLRGLVTGIIVYTFGVLVVFETSKPSGTPLDILIIVGPMVLFAPIILFGLLIGWMWGRIKKDKKFRII
jgi:hypothetical protein